MRSVIEEIATAEQQAEEIRQGAVLQARELTQKAKEDALAALSQLDRDARADMQSALEAAKQEGESLSSFVEASIRESITRRQLQGEFVARGLASAKASK